MFLFPLYKNQVNNICYVLFTLLLHDAMILGITSLVLGLQKGSISDDPIM